MGWIVWFAESLLCLVASYWTAAAIYPDKGLAHRLVVTLLIAPSLILVVVQGCGLIGHFERVSAGILGLLVFGAVLAFAWRAIPTEQLRSTLRSDLSSLRSFPSELFRSREVAILNIILGTSIAVGGAAFIWFYRSWDWDCLALHKLVTDFTVQLKSLGWNDYFLTFVTGYPRNVELLAAWNCMFSLDNRLDDSSQWFFAILGVLLIIAWARRLGIGRPLALAVSTTWLALPPIFLQLNTTHNDIACAVLLAAAVYFCSDRVSAQDRWMAMIAFGLYVGTKFTGLFHLLLLAPVILIRAIIELGQAKGQRVSRLISLALSVSPLIVLGAFKYVQNFLHAANPLYPFLVNIPWLGLRIPGPMDPYVFYGGGANYLFESWSLVKRVVLSWFDTNPVYWPDVRSGGFGPLFCWILAPAVAWVILEVAVWRQWRAGLPILLLFLLTFSVPAPWWPRYVIAGPIAGLLALTIFYRRLKWRWLQTIASALVASLTILGFYRAWSKAPGPGWKEFRQAVQSSPAERAGLQLIGWQWPTEWGLRRERELQTGDVVVHDDSVPFPAELFSHDYRTRVVYVPSNQPLGTYLQQIRELKPKWLAVRAGTMAEAAVRAQGGQYLFTPPLGPSNIYRMSW